MGMIMLAKPVKIFCPPIKNNHFPCTSNVLTFLRFKIYGTSQKEDKIILTK